MRSGSRPGGCATWKQAPTGSSSSRTARRATRTPTWRWSRAGGPTEDLGDDLDRRPERDAVIHVLDVPVVHADAAVGDGHPEELRVRRPVEADDPTARPVGEPGRVRARLERVVAEAGPVRVDPRVELPRHVEEAGRRRRARLADRDAARAQETVATPELEAACPHVDDHALLHRPELDGRSRDPAGSSVR